MHRVRTKNITGIIARFPFGLLVVAVALVAAAAAASSEYPFSRESIVADDFFSAAGVAAADLDGDGDLDILGAAVDVDTVGWWENRDGDGSAWTGQIVDDTFAMAESVSAADVDGDGDLDVVGGGGSEIAWWQNVAGDGSTWNRYRVALVSEASEVTVADIDSDGDLDLLAALFGDGKVSWWENVAADGTTWSEHPVASDAVDASSTAAADVDGDGDLDVLVAQAGDGVTWWENVAGDGSAWTGHTVDGTFAGAESVTAADVDSDGDLDLVGGSRGLNEVVWWESTAGDGRVWQLHTVVGDFYGAYAVTTTDLDGDGDIDILAAANTDDDISWWENRAGDGSAWVEHGVVGAFDGALAIAAADIDGDGDRDVLGAAINADTIAWWENDLPSHGAVFVASPKTSTAGSESTAATSAGAASPAATADLDRDGDLDVVGTDYNGERVAWWQNTASDGSTWTEYTVDAAFRTPAAVEVADVDGDGDTDIVGASDSDDDIVWWRNLEGDGSSWGKVTVDGLVAGAASVAAADIDADGDIDILAAARDGDEVSWWESTAGDGTVWLRHPVADQFDGASGVAVADIDGDGSLDAVGCAAVAGTVTWWRNKAGDGTVWQPYQVDGDFAGGVQVAAADVDGDGDTDLLGAAGFGREITWWENGTGDGTTWIEHTLDGIISARSALAVDLDGDGDADVLGAGENEVVWWENTGSEPVSWPRHTVDSSFRGAGPALAADINGDGAPDILAVSGGAEVTIWPNRGRQPGENLAE